MNWLIFAMITYAAMALEMGLEPMPVLGRVSFMLILAVFVGLMARPHAVVCALLILGVLVDLKHLVGLIGPAALGYGVGAYAVLRLRSLVFRESILALAVMVFAVGLCVQLVIVALLTVRGLDWIRAQPIEHWILADELKNRFVDLILSVIAAVPISYGLFRFAAIWNFQAKTRSERHF